MQHRRNACVICLGSGDAGSARCSACRGTGVMSEREIRAFLDQVHSLLPLSLAHDVRLSFAGVEQDAPGADAGDRDDR